MKKYSVKKATTKKEIVVTKEYSFTVIFKPLPDGGYQVSVPALPEIITAGRTIHEAREMARDAICCALEGMAKEGELISLLT